MMIDQTTNTIILQNLAHFLNIIQIIDYEYYKVSKFNILI